MSELIQRIGDLAGPQRANTFMAAAQFVLGLKSPTIIETGCYRGMACDGNSTLIMAWLARATRGYALSLEINGNHIAMASKLLVENGLSRELGFFLGDSLTSIQFLECAFRFAYLDSYDFEEKNHVPSQQHQLAEVQELLPKMAHPSAFLLDDYALPYGGKTGLSLPALKAAGYEVVAEGYQVFLIHP